MRSPSYKGISGWVTGRPWSSTTVSSPTSAVRSKSSIASGRTPTASVVYPGARTGALAGGEGSARGVERARRVLRQGKGGATPCPWRDLLGRDRAAEVEALTQRASLFDQEPPLLLGLDALGQGHHPHTLGELHHRPHHAGGLVIVRHVAHEGAVDLQDVHRQVLQ